MNTNNVTRLLDGRKIPYQAFDLPVEKLGALEISALLGFPAGQVFKTIVVTPPKGKPLLCAIPGDRVVDLKLVAQATNEKKVNLPTQDEAEALTGLLAGGISPLALINKGFKTLIDQSALNFSEILISGGQRGLTLKMKPADLQKLTNAQMASISTAIE